MTRNALFTALWMAMAALALAAPAARPRWMLAYDFDKALRLTPYPRSQAADVTLVPGRTGNAVRMAPTKGRVTAYCSSRLAPDGPGTMMVKFDYKFAKASDAKLSVTLNCNLEGKRNGSAGRIGDEAPPATEWTTYHRVFTIPDKTHAIQFAFGAAGAGADILIDNLTLVYTPDTVTVPVAKAVDFNAPATSPAWNPRDLQYGFYSHGKDAATPASMQVAADANGLYFLFRNYTDPAKVKKQATRRDGALWNDDANEILVFNEKQGAGWHFIVNAAGALFDARFHQRVPGDPWRSDAKWDGEWKGAAKITSDGFETRFFLPWKLFGIDPSQAAELRINPACDYPGAREFPHWNAYRGNRHDLGKYGRLQLEGGKLTIARARTADTLSYAIPRKNPQFESLLDKGVPGNYQTDLWAHGLLRKEYPAPLMARTSDEQFSAWQDELLRAWAAAGIGGPAWPWCMNHGKERMTRRVREQGVKYPFSISNSSLRVAARKAGAQFINPQSSNACDATDPHFVAEVEKFIRSRAKDPNYALMKETIKFSMGLDEPTNQVKYAYDPTINKSGADAIAKVSELVKREYGFGKYGVPFIPGTPEADLPFARIAFYRWWNRRLKTCLARLQTACKEVFPGVPVMLLDDNNCSGQSILDAAVMNGLAELISTDPYPTSTNAHFGMARALYHVGFSCRVLRDLVPSAKLMAMPQCFVYHGGHGDLPAMREWASQAIKNGAVHFMWYTSHAVHTIFDDYAGMLELSAMLRKMDRVRLPQDTRTLVWYSNYDKWAAADRVLHATYTVYSILEEHLGSNFRFISDTTLEQGDVNLDDYRLLYVPAMGYTTPKLSARLVKWVEQGGTIVAFDPNFLRQNLDGSPNADRAKLTGQAADLLVKTSANSSLAWNGKTLPAAMIANAPALPGSRFASYSIQAKGAKVLMAYADGTPAALERAIGKGKVVYFAVQPFAGSDAAVNPGAWRDFFAAQAQAVGEPIDLPICNLLLPDPPKVVKLKKLLK